MKKFLTQQINFAYAVMVMLTLTLGVSFAGAYSSPTLDSSGIHPLVHQGGGEQAIDALRIGNCSSLEECIGSLDIRGALNNIARFDTSSIDNFFTVTGNSTLEERLFVGDGASPTASLWTSTYPTPDGGFSQLESFEIPLQQVNVYGNARATNLSNTNPNAEVCVDRQGVLILCPEATPTPVDGVCGYADGLPDDEPPTNGLCDAGVASSVTTGASNYTWTCGGINGGDDASCSAPISEESYSWYVGDWGECNESGSCTGQTPGTQKVDWNGNPFEWEDKVIYYDDGSGTPIAWTCFSRPNNNTAIGEKHITDEQITSLHDGFFGGNDSIPCTGYFMFDYYTIDDYVFYEPSVETGLWNRITMDHILNTSPELGYNDGAEIITQDDHTSLYEMLACNTSKGQSACVAKPGCTWENQPGTQSRTVYCQSAIGQMMNDSYCERIRKPAEIRSCGEFSSID